jgi:hypothetical protein
LPGGTGSIGAAVLGEHGLESIFHVAPGIKNGEAEKAKRTMTNTIDRLMSGQQGELLY